MDARRTFVPVLVPGVAAAALAAVAGAREWARLGSAVAKTVPVDAPGLSSAGEVPLASALSLVALAAWGALLVTRGRIRRLVAVIGLVAALALAGVTVAGAWSAPHGLRTALEDDFALPSGSAAHADVHLTGWYWCALVAVVVVVGAFALAVRWSPSWPVMARRYDAPGSQAAPRSPSTNQELWKAIDEGHDPTT
jgi:hypothetical protein